MPGLSKKILVLATIDGVVLQPLTQRNQRQSSTVVIDYKRHGIASKSGSFENVATEGLECSGIAGLLTVARTSFLIAISKKEQVALIRGSPVYVVRDVTLVPLSSRDEALQAISHSKLDAQKTSSSTIESGEEEGDSSEDVDRHGLPTNEDPGDEQLIPSSLQTTKSPQPDEGYSSVNKQSSVVEDVIGKKGVYGRFAQDWFSRQGWSVDKRKLQGMSSDEQAPAENALSQMLDSEEETNIKSSEAGNDLTSTLLPKLLRTTRMLLSSGNVYFSYDHDLTRSLGDQSSIPKDLPLWKRVDPLFFWNKHLALPLIETGQDSLVLPLMQGFVGQQKFTINTSNQNESKESSKSSPDNPSAEVITSESSGATESSEKSNFLLTLISRRSIKRPGLRYLRRGVDEDGNVANFVETEQILSSPAWDPVKSIYSFIQIRGSIPLYFSQSPYAFKPIPILHHSPEANQAAFKKHFAEIEKIYGMVQAVSLVDKTNTEAQIGQEYEKNVELYNSKIGSENSLVAFEWFDFHAICKGMKFENVSQLMDKLGSKLQDIEESVELQGKVLTRQKGVIRTNCMDCLDRTGVVQSAFGKEALQYQLRKEGIGLELPPGAEIQWFNTLWADNGDAISRQYSSTAALKGDFTRTRKRNYRGALQDLGLTLSRYFNNIVNDYFAQATIDYLLGNVNVKVFEEFEANMMSADPAVSMGRVRQTAIETSSKIVIADSSEDLLSGWTMLAPHEENSLRTFPFVEVVVLLTNTALYAVTYDWDSEKVVSFQRINLFHILDIHYGTYIISALTNVQMDEKRNVGLMVRYKRGKEDIVRVNTRTLNGTEHLSGDDITAATPLPGIVSASAEPALPDPARILALKALPSQSSVDRPTSHGPHTVSELEFVQNVCNEIERAALAESAISPIHNSSKSLVSEGDVISLAEAKRGTGLWEVLGHSLKKLVWA